MVTKSDTTIYKDERSPAAPPTIITINSPIFIFSPYFSLSHTQNPAATAIIISAPTKIISPMVFLIDASG